MVESGSLPGFVVVTGLAFLPEFELVFVLFQMTGIAIAGCILEAVGQVATLASGCDVSAGKRKPGFGVVKALDFPGTVTVAFLAIGTGLPLVFVILLVATEAIDRCIPEI